ncbi:glycoprotease [Colletotrichum abscissum]|uniref:Glycoprotease n=1 Tax=Colletotrichum abscissum TaxID=1671311 RepID=A0A9P9X1M5_9PEZI|nr:glycoprotease [Colletotrichum abscissum]KAI3531112.1 glycoprotease [Colletotrichum abscissum]KAK1472948.1 glycoprotease [Colletotrichum abscissum]
MRCPSLTIFQRWRAPSLHLHRTINGNAAIAPAAHVRPTPFRQQNQLQRQHQYRTLLTLAIETSCDDTCVALLSKDPGPLGRATLHFHRKITSDSTAYGGVYPPVALRSHDASLAPLVAEALSSLPPAASEEEARNHDDSKLIREGGKGLSSNNTLTVAGTLRQKPDFVTVTRGPGMSANLASGLSTAKGLATAWQVPLLAVNHMQAHALTPRLVSALARHDPTTSTASSSTTASSSPTVDVTATKKPEYPFLTLLVSGGHTQLVHSRSLTSHRILASSSNIAVGDALDKAARHILPPDMLASHGDVMYGALLERFAFPDSFVPSSLSSSDPKSQHGHDYEYTPPLRRVDEIAPYTAPPPYSWTLHPPLSASRALSYEFNGLGSEVRKIATSRGGSMSLDERRILARATMRLLFEHLATRIFLALAAEPELKDALKTLVVSGGVASNRFLMHVLRKLLYVRGFEHVEITAPPPALCTDNAAMIAWTGMEMYEAGWESSLSVHPERKWSIDPSSEEGGILGVPGWRRREH